MLKDSKTFKVINEKQTLDSNLLVITLLHKLFEEGIINLPTYEKARKEIER